MRTTALFDMLMLHVIKASFNERRRERSDLVNHERGRGCGCVGHIERIRGDVNPRRLCPAAPLRFVAGNMDALRIE